MMKDVRKRLESMGYTPARQDDWPLKFAINKVEQDIRGGTGQKEIPSGLYYTAVDMAVGEFLLMKKASPEGLEGFDLELAAKSISLGDTSVTLTAGDSGSTPEQRLDALINHLMKGKGNYGRYRRITW